MTDSKTIKVKCMCKDEPACEGHNYEFGILMPVFAVEKHVFKAGDRITPGDMMPIHPEIIREDVLVICSFCGHSKRMSIEDLTK